MTESNIALESKLASFVMTVDGERCMLDFALADDIMDIRSVRVPDAVGGRGLAGKLTRHALSWAESESLRVIPSCPYVAAWIKRHPDYKALVAS